jgi:hypothetical protein
MYFPTECLVFTLNSRLEDPGPRNVCFPACHRGAPRTPRWVLFVIQL